MQEAGLPMLLKGGRMRQRGGRPAGGGAMGDTIGPDQACPRQHLDDLSLPDPLTGFAEHVSV